MIRVAAVLVVLALCACSPQSALKASPLLAVGLDAYQRGDFAAFEKTMAQAQAAAAPRAGEGCSLAVAGLRHDGLVAAQLRQLDQARVFDMPEEGRFLYLTAVYVGHGKGDATTPAPALDCPQAPREARAADGIDRDSVQVALGSRMNDWDQDLRRRLGADYEARMRAAAAVLIRNGYVLPGYS